MPAIQLSDAYIEGILEDLNSAVWGVGGSGILAIDLLTSPVIPPGFSQYLDFAAILCDGFQMPGYATIQFVSPPATPSQLGNTTIYTFPGCLFTLASAIAPLTLYGYLAWNQVSSLANWVQIFDAPVTVQNPGDQVYFAPLFTGFSQNPPP